MTTPSGTERSVADGGSGTTATPVATTPTATTPTAATPAADWCFLLPTTSLGRIGLAGRSPEAARDLGPDVHPLGRRAPGDPPFDTVVLVHPDRTALRAAIDALTPSGTIRLEDVPRLRRRRLRNGLDAGGFEVHTWWHRPSLADTWAIVGLDRPVAASTMLRGVAGRRRRGRLEALLARTGLARLLAADVAVTATRRADVGHGRPPVLAPLRSTPVDALLTPRYLTSRSVIGVTATADGRRIAHVAKTTRSPLDADLVVREAAALDALATRAAAPGAAPDAHRLVLREEHAVLVESGAPGRPLDRRTVRQDPDAALRAGVAWLEQLRPVGSSAPAEDGRAHRLLDPALARLAELGGERHRERLEAAALAERLLAPIRDQELPVVFEHGDLSHPNIFRRRDGRIVVVDWERAEPEGLPLHDLTYFTAYLAESVGSRRRHEGLLAAHHRANGPRGWARPVIERHLGHLGIDSVQAALLELAAWTRYLAALTVTPARVQRPTPDRCEVLWMAALERAREVTT